MPNPKGELKLTSKSDCSQKDWVSVSVQQAAQPVVSPRKSLRIKPPQQAVGKRIFSVPLWKISVSLWWNYPENIHHRGTEIAQRHGDRFFPTDSSAGWQPAVHFWPWCTRQA